MPCLPIVVYALADALEEMCFLPPSGLQGRPLDHAVEAVLEVPPLVGRDGIKPLSGALSVERRPFNWAPVTGPTG